MNFRAIIDWLTLADYEAAKERATEQIVARFARGNTAVQNGQYIDEDKLRDLSAAGDRATESLRRYVG
jgi:hypothetical protein